MAKKVRVAIVGLGFGVDAGAHLRARRDLAIEHFVGDRVRLDRGALLLEHVCEIRFQFHHDLGPLLQDRENLSGGKCYAASPHVRPRRSFPICATVS